MIDREGDKMNCLQLDKLVHAIYYACACILTLGTGFLCGMSYERMRGK